MGEKFRGRRPNQRPPRSLAPSGRTYPAGLDQPVEREAGQRNTADRLDLGARDRLVIGDDRQRLDRSAGQSARDNALALQFRREIRRGAEGPAAGDAHEVDTVPVIRVGKLAHQQRDIDVRAEMPRQLLLRERLRRREKQGLQQPQPMPALAHPGISRSPEEPAGRLRRCIGPNALSWRSSTRPVRASSSTAAKVAAKAERRKMPPRHSSGRKAASSRHSGTWPTRPPRRRSASSNEYSAGGATIRTSPWRRR